MWKQATLVAAIAVACGASSSEIQRAKTVSYRTNFADVWNTLEDQVHVYFPVFKIDDAVHGHILTEWFWVEDPDANTAAGDQATNTNGATMARSTGQTTAIKAGIYMQMEATVKGGPTTWKVEINGQAAEYKPGMTNFIPMEHNADEPPYVHERVEKIYVALYRKFGKYAIDTTKKEAAPKPVELDKTAWKGLPDGAVTVLTGVHKAAANSDGGALRALMADDFVWSSGGEASADTAIALWAADPSTFKAMGQVLDAGCGASEDGSMVVCPPGAKPDGAGPRAGFKKAGAGWKFAFFLKD